MMSKLNVIALISGGKDSFFSLLHCLQNGHEVVALANLYPDDVNTEDSESYMYQTIGHSIIPLYAEALGIPLYRAPITGGARNTDKIYQYSPHPLNPTDTPKSPAHPNSQPINSTSDETEALIPLLAHILALHPSANALSTGAILSTYQRTRIESICTRLNLVSLAYLWQYPSLPPYTQTSLLHDIRAAGQDSRIVKTASGGLSERDLWMQIGEETGVKRLVSTMSRFGGGELEEGSVLGEGGEYETLTLDGPAPVWKGRIEIPEAGREVVRGDGGSWTLRLTGARVDPNEESDMTVVGPLVRVPELYDDEFKILLEELGHEEPDPAQKRTSPEPEQHANSPTCVRNFIRHLHHQTLPSPNAIYITDLKPPVSSPSDSSQTSSSIHEQTNHILTRLTSHLKAHNLTPAHLTSTTILLRRMSDFPLLNALYGALFTAPNPPARVTVACGDSLPVGVDVMLNAIASKSAGEGKDRGVGERRGLHVQSQSYWAPANIGPYAQAIAVPLLPFLPPSLSPPSLETEPQHQGTLEIIHPAGQIPLRPPSMSLHPGTFLEQTILSLQHLWRIGRVMGVKWWGGGGVAFITPDGGEAAGEKARVVGRAWRGTHQHGRGGEETGDCDGGEEEEEEIDIAEIALRRPWAMPASGGRGGGAVSIRTRRAALPDYASVSILGSDGKPVVNAKKASRCFIVQVAELPRGAAVEWTSFGFAGQGLRVVLRQNQDAEQRGMSADVGGVDVCEASSADTTGAGAGAGAGAAFRVSWLGVSTAEELEELYEVLAEFAQKGPGMEGLLEVYTSRLPGEQVFRCPGVMVVPCRRVFDEDGSELCAAVRHRGYITDAD